MILFRVTVHGSRMVSAILLAKRPTFLGTPPSCRQKTLLFANKIAMSVHAVAVTVSAHALLNALIFQEIANLLKNQSNGYQNDLHGGQTGVIEVLVRANPSLFDIVNMGSFA